MRHNSCDVVNERVHTGIVLVTGIVLCICYDLFAGNFYRPVDEIRRYPTECYNNRNNNSNNNRNI